MNLFERVKREFQIKPGKERRWRRGPFGGTLVPYIHPDYKRNGMPGRYQIQVFANASGPGVRDPIVTRAYYTSSLETLEDWMNTGSFIDIADGMLWEPPHRVAFLHGEGWEKREEKATHIVGNDQLPKREKMTIADA